MGMFQKWLSADVASFANRFRQLLLKSHITHPLQEILEVIARRLSSRMIVCESPAAALELYEDAKLIPGASTCGHLMTQHGVRVNGPFFTRCSLEMLSDSLLQTSPNRDIISKRSLGRC